MAKKKPAKRTTQAELAALLKLDLPGGNHVYFKRHSETSIAETRELEILQGYLYPKLKAIANASSVSSDDGEDVDEVDEDDPRFLEAAVHLSRQDMRDLNEMTELAAIAYLKSWTLRTGDGPRPLPTTVKELQTLPRPIYEAISRQASKILNANETAFDIDSVPDTESPTGASDA